VGAYWETSGPKTGGCATKCLFTAAALALMVSGCAAATGPQKYPSDWASIQTTPIQHDCPSVGGTYSDRAAASFPGEASAAPTLSELFTAMGSASTSTLHGAWNSIGESASVVLHQTPESLTVAFVNAAGVETRLNFERQTTVLVFSMNALIDKFQCLRAGGQPRLRFFDETSGYSSGGAFGESGGSGIRLLKATDGSLIVQAQSQNFQMINAVVAPVPDFHVSSVWYRYSALAAGGLATTP
jgi:hypothetical protein